MNTTVRSILLGGGIGAVLIAGLFAYFIFFSSPPSNTNTGVSAANAQPQNRYENEEYGFSFVLPEGFGAEELQGAVVISNEAGDGIQVVITPLQEDILHLTEERIRADLPSLEIRDPEVIEIGEGRTGLLFKSNNEAFEGASQEVWFVYESNLYQLNTYQRLSPLLEKIGETWSFL